MSAATPERAQGMGSARLSLWLMRYAFGRWPGLVAMLGTMLFNVGLEVLKPWPLKVLVDNVLSGKPLSPVVGSIAGALPGAGTREGLLSWTLISTVLLFVLSWALGMATTYAKIGFGQRMVYDLAADVFAHLQALSMRFHSRKSTGDSIRRVTTDSGAVSSILQDALFPMLSALFSLFAVFAIMWQLDSELTLLSLLVVPALALVLRLYSGRMAQRSYAQQEAEGAMYSVIEQTLSAIPVVQAFQGEERADSQLAATTESILRATMSTTRVQLRFKVLSGLATALGTAAIIWVGVQHALTGSLTVGSILVFLSYLASLYGPLETLMYTSSGVQNAIGSARRVVEIMRTEPDVVGRPGARLLPPVQGHVLLDNITFGYDAGQPVLHSVYLDVLPGQTVALVGPTGAGKTTLASMVARFADPWQGHVWIDGFDAREVELKSLRKQVSVVLQDPLLMPVTVAENIAYGRPNATQAEIEAAARAVQAHDFIMRMPQGYNTVIGEQGTTLSGGEKQRISIARALLKNAPVLVLDEPTSALDVETERLLVEALRRLIVGRTTFIIAHRLSTIMAADRIVAMQDGRIIEEGTHADLLARGGFYAHLYSIQSGTPSPAARTGPITAPLTHEVVLGEAAR